MLGNLFSIHDIPLFVDKLRQRRLGHLLPNLLRGRSIKSWNHLSCETRNWWDIPAVMARWNRMVTGDPGVEYLAHLLDTRLAGLDGIRALTAGCGTGYRELELAATGRFSQIDAIDRNAARIAHARKKLAGSGAEETVRYLIGDVCRHPLGKETYDLVIAEQSLHHFHPLDRAVRQLEQALRPGGWLVFNEYVGPARFGWTDSQIAAVDTLLAALPESYRRQWRSGRVKRRVHRPGRLAMILWDRSEAVESDRILPLLREAFAEVETRGYGGTVIQLLFKDIAHNFRGDDAETRRLLGVCFDFEDRLIAAGALGHDFVTGLCRKAE